MNIGFRSGCEPFRWVRWVGRRPTPFSPSPHESTRRQ
jgi:hypothetical protein